MEGHRYLMAVPLHFFPSGLMTDSLGARLRHERERRQIALTSIAEGTKINLSLLEGLERDDVSRWPSGIFRKSYVRSYAEAIGIDPEPIVKEFLRRYPDPLESELSPNPPPTPSVLDHVPKPADAGQSTGPLTIKLTISWSGTAFSGKGGWLRRLWEIWRPTPTRRATHQS